MNAYIVTITDRYEDTTDIVSVHLGPAAALKAMKQMAAEDGSYRQLQTEGEQFPWYESDEMVIEIQTHPIN
jgi:hypothetical protein